MLDNYIGWAGFGVVVLGLFVAARIALRLVLLAWFVIEDLLRAEPPERVQTSAIYPVKVTARPPAPPNPTQLRQAA